MDQLINEQTIAEILQLGGQYFIPASALLRALYNGIRRKFPEGFLNIAFASMATGVTAVMDGQTVEVRNIIGEFLGNTTFMAGLLSFIFIYLISLPNKGLYVDGVVGGIVGLVTFVVWVGLLGNTFPWWFAVVFIAAGAAAFIFLRFLLRQIARLVRLATTLIIIGIGLVVVGGGILLLQTLLTQTPG
jgi:hypothetical protein